MALFILILATPGILQFVQLGSVLVTGKYLVHGGFRIAADLATLIGLPGLYLGMYDWELPNDCCAMDSAFFSPAYRPYAYAFLIIIAAAYLFALFRRGVSPPLPELLLQVLLMCGLGTSILVTIHVKDPLLALLGSVPVSAMFLSRLVIEHLNHIQQVEPPETGEAFWSNISRRVLRSPIWIKYPVFVALILPFFAMLSGMLMIFGQRPDALVKAFTETYRHGLSALSCADVVCPDEHYLCTVASKGHRKLVRPLRPGRRHGRPIMVNRQLLVSNAFEEVVQERWPSFHRWIRLHYDRYGFRFRKACLWLGSPWVSDIVYLGMKPAEWGFIIFLYTIERQPERRISRQYLQ